MIGETLSKLAPSEWERTMTHNEGKSVTLSRLVEKADGHIVSHAEQLQNLAQHINSLN
jgi:hypothetical protein